MDYGRWVLLMVMGVVFSSGICLGGDEDAGWRKEKDVCYAKIDGVELRMDLYLPTKAEGEVPVVVWIHGGAWQAGDKNFCLAMPLLADGIAVASIDYRLTDVAVMPGQIYDCKAAVRYLRGNAKKYNIDGEHIGAWGDSAGGHLAALLGSSNGVAELEGNIGEYVGVSSDVQAVCDWYGPSELLTMPNNDEVNRSFKDGKSPVELLIGGSYSEKKAMGELASPITHVDKKDPPFLIMHGTVDNIVPIEQSRKLYKKQLEAGVDTRLVEMAGYGHWFGEAGEAYKTVADFFLRTLKKPEAVCGFETDWIVTNNSEKLLVSFIGHGTLMLQYDGKVIHVDPWSKLADYSKLPKADAILITHEHMDHLDIKAISQIRKRWTEILLPEACKQNVRNGEVMANGDNRMLLGEILVEAVPAYNIVHKRPGGEAFHPKGRGNGYVLNMGGARVYIAGDSENVPEMKVLKDIDVAFLPMNLPYTMTPEMVAEAAKAFKPRVLYPYHYGETDVNELVELMKGQYDTEVRVRQMQ